MKYLFIFIGIFFLLFFCSKGNYVVLKSNFKEKSLLDIIYNFIYEKFSNIKNFPLFNTVSEDSNSNFLTKNSEKLLHDRPKERTNRILQTNSACIHGNLVELNVTFYTCNGVNVTKDVYDIFQRLNQTKNCTVTNTKKKYCVCPKDFMGQQCEISTRVSCYLWWINPPQEEINCSKPNTDIYYYDFSRFGIKPCIFVNKNTKINAKVRLNCSLPPGTIETAYPPDGEYINSSQIPKQNFVYEVNTPSLSLTYSQICEIRIIVRNFNRLSKNNEWSFSNLIPQYFTGTSDIPFTFNFNLYGNLEVAGRWYVDAMGTLPSRENTSISVNKVAFEDSDYTEPPPPSQINKLALGLGLGLGLGLVAIIATILIIYFCAYRKKKRVLLERDNLKMSPQPIE